MRIGEFAHKDVSCCVLNDTSSLTSPKRTSGFYPDNVAAVLNSLT